MAPWLTAACAEAYLRTKEAAFADFAFEMTEQVCALQYELDDVRHPSWHGGFRAWGADGKAVPDSQPTVEAGLYALGLGEACRAAKQTADLGRAQRYGAALKHALQFLARLQYAEANTQHFAPAYRAWLAGGFRAAPDDGNLRTDHTGWAVAALSGFLAHVAERP